MVAPSPSSAAALPEALTAQILQHVPQQQRLQQCALTCKAWASAATLATVHVDQTLQAGDQAIPVFESWLQKYAGQLEGLQLTLKGRGYDEYHTLQLPWENLSKLQCWQLEGFRLQLPEDGGHPGDSSSSTPAQAPSRAGVTSISCAENTVSPAPLLLPSLQHLHLTVIQVDSISSLQQLLLAAPGLTSLRVNSIISMQPKGYRSHRSNSITATQQLAAAIPGLLQQLPRLAVLELPGFPISDAAVQQLGCMQGLQELWLEKVDHVPVCNLQPLPSSLTRLEFHGKSYGRHSEELPNSPSLPPQLLQLAGLMRLKLCDCSIPPTVLGAFTRLQSLCLEHCALLPRNAAAVGEDEDPTFSTVGTVALLDVLDRLTNLQDLELSLEGLDTVSTDPERFSALTASTRLTRLVLNPDDAIPLPKGVAQYMFPAGGQLPLLQHLSISPELLDPEGWDADEWCLDGADVGRIAECCTGLEWLELSLVVEPGADVSGLLQLPDSCTRLLLGGSAFGDAAASVLAQLRQLEYLCVHKASGFSDAGLLQLAETDMDLWLLYVHDAGLSDAISKEGEVQLEWSPEASVQQQLEALCDLSPVCAPARLQKQKEANTQLQTENSALRMKLRHSQAQLRRSEAQVQLLQQQLQAAQTAGQQV